MSLTRRSTASSAGFACAIPLLGEASEGAVEAPSDQYGAGPLIRFSRRCKYPFRTAL